MLFRHAVRPFIIGAERLGVRFRDRLRPFDITTEYWVVSFRRKVRPDVTTTEKLASFSADIMTLSY